MIVPGLDLSLLFPPKDTSTAMPSGVISREKIVTKRFAFNVQKLTLLIARITCANPTRVETVTSLI